MLLVLKYLKARYVSEKAQGIVEYALILGFVVVISAALANGNMLEQNVHQIFQALGDRLNEAAGASDVHLGGSGYGNGGPHN